MDTVEELQKQITNLNARLEKAKEVFKEQKSEIDELKERVTKTDKMCDNIKSAVANIAFSMKDLTMYVKALNDIVNA